MSTSTPRGYGHDLQHDAAWLQSKITGANPTPFWLDSPARPAPRPALSGDARADLVVVGAGYCGLWAALIAKERDPGRSVIVLEARQAGWAASGRNGGFCEMSLTHGEVNGARHFAEELPAIEQVARANFRGLEQSIERYGIDAEYENTGILVVATEEHQVDPLRAAAQASPDPDSRFFDRDQVREQVNSPLYLAGRFKKDGYSFVHPAKLAWGLRRACLDLGVQIYEHTPVRGLVRSSRDVQVRTDGGTIRARKVALATNGFPALLARNEWFSVPIYDYALMTQPLTEAQLEAIGWTGRHGITDSSREFHYYRKSADNRILFGGYDAIYHRGGKVRGAQEQRPETFLRLADHFLSTFPQLQDITFTHAWGGMIDMSTNLVAFHGTAMGGHVAYSAGFTGLGVGATRFGAETMLDLLEGDETPRTRLAMVGSKPMPVPPEPLAYPLVQLMRRAVAKSDARDDGQGTFLLRLADRFGVGFDS